MRADASQVAGDAAAAGDSGAPPADSGVRDDVGPPHDSGAERDAGFPADAAFADSGFPDTGSPDAGFFADAGFPPDAMVVNRMCPPPGPYGNRTGSTSVDVALPDCDGNMRSIRDLCSKKAAWIFTLAGW